MLGVRQAHSRPFAETHDLPDQRAVNQVRLESVKLYAPVPGIEGTAWRRPGNPRDEHGRFPHGSSVVAVGLGILLTVGMLSFTLTSLLLEGAPGPAPIATWGLFTLLVGLIALAAGGAALLSRHARERSVRVEAGFLLPRGREIYRIGVLVGGATASLGTLALTNLLAGRAAFAGLTDGWHGAVSYGPLAASLWLLLFLVLVPVLYEMYFRGYLYGWVRGRWGVGAGALLSAAIFAVAAYGSPCLLPFGFVLGLSAAFAWQFGRSVADPIALHVLVNTVALGVAIAS